MIGLFCHWRPFIQFHRFTPDRSYGINELLHGDRSHGIIALLATATAHMGSLLYWRSLIWDHFRCEEKLKQQNLMFLDLLRTIGLFAAMKLFQVQLNIFLCKIPPIV